MSALPGYDAWKLDEPEEIYCPDCERAAYAPEPRFREHAENCKRHPSYDESRAKVAEELVRDLLAPVIAETEDFALVDAAFAHNHVRGHIVNVPVWVSEPAIREAL